MRGLTCVALGDAGCGKTCMILSFVNNAAPTGYNATVYDRYEQTLIVDGERVLLQLCDTGGGDQCDELRPESMKSVDCVLLCYSVASHNSFTNVVNKWLPFARRYAPKGATLLLVGCKQDLRTDASMQQQMRQAGREYVTVTEAANLARSVGGGGGGGGDDGDGGNGGMPVCECSATTQSGLKQTMDTVVATATTGRKQHGGCAIM